MLHLLVVLVVRNVTMTVVGQPVAQFWGYKTDGLFRTDEEAANYVNSKENVFSLLQLPEI